MQAMAEQEGPGGEMARTTLDNRLLEPGSYEEELLAAYHYMAAVAGSSNGWGGFNIHLESGFTLYFGEDGPGEILPPATASLVRRLMPWLVTEAGRIRGEIERQRRPIGKGAA